MGKRLAMALSAWFALLHGGEHSIGTTGGLAGNLEYLQRGGTQHSGHIRQRTAHVGATHCVVRAL